MADDNNPEKIDKNNGKTVDESGLKQTIDSVSLDGIDSLLPETETTNTKQTKKLTTSSLSGIDDITSYIQKQKQKNERMSPDLLTARDGTDLLTQEGVYAIVPHKKNDHKIVYTRESAPKDLVTDPKRRKKGTEYKKNGMKIYDVHVDYAEHPTLKSTDGQPLDVWIIDDPKDLDAQLQAIRDGKGGGTNFMSPVINETKEEEVKKDSGIDVTPLKEKPKKRRKTRVKKTQVEEKETDETSNKATIETEKDNKKEGLSLDDILPIGEVDGEKESKNENKEEPSKKQSLTKEKSLSDILPPSSEENDDESKDDTTQESKDESPKNLKTLDDILPTTEDTSNITKEVDSKNDNKDSPKKDLSLDDILPSKKKIQEKDDTEEEVTEKSINKKEDLSLNDILPSQPKTVKESDNKKDINKNVDLPAFSLDDILPSKNEDEDTTQDTSKQEDLILDEEVIEAEESVSLPKETADQSNNLERIDADENIQQETTVPRDKTVDETKKDSETSLEEKFDEDTEINTTKIEEEKLPESETAVLTDFDLSDIVPNDKDSKKESTSEIELPEIVLPDLDSFTPKDPIDLPDIITPEPVPVTTQTRGNSFGDTITPPKQEETIIPDWSNNFSATDIIDTTQETTELPLPIKTPEVKPTEDTLPSESFSLPESAEPMVSESPQEAEPAQDIEIKKNDDLIDLDDMTFEPITQDEPRGGSRTVYNDGIIGNEDQGQEASNNKGKLIMLIIKSFFALMLVGLAVWIVIIMLGGSNKSVDLDLSDTPAIVDTVTGEELPEDTTPPEDPIPEPEPTSPEPTPAPQPQPMEPQEQPEPIAPEPTIQQFTIPELIAKIQAQQIEARKLLNKAKLLNDREGIKFATAALLKSSKLIQEAKDDPTITADQLQRDAKRIDLYLGQAQSIVEG